MPSGGKRPGAGRPRGSKTKKSQVIAIAAMAEGITPLEFMLSIMRDESVDGAIRMDMAKACAPYTHARLASTEIKAEVEETQVVIFKTTYEDHAAGIEPVRYSPMKTIEHGD